MTGVAVAQRAVLQELTIKHRDEARRHRTAAERAVHATAHLRGGIDRVGLTGEQSLHHGGQQRGGRPLAGHVGHGERQCAVVARHVVEQVAADRAAWRGAGHQLHPGRRVVIRRQQRALDLRGDAQLMRRTLGLHRLLIEPRVLDDHRSLGRERVQHAGGLQVALLAAVQIQHTDAALTGIRRRGVAEMPHLERRAQDVTDAEGQRAAVM